jgi:hypothetical protein
MSAIAGFQQIGSERCMDRSKSHVYDSLRHFTLTALYSIGGVHGVTDVKEPRLVVSTGIPLRSTVNLFILF